MRYLLQPLTHVHHNFLTRALLHTLMALTMRYLLQPLAHALLKLIPQGPLCAYLLLKLRYTLLVAALIALYASVCTYMCVYTYVSSLHAPRGCARRPAPVQYMCMHASIYACMQVYMRMCVCMHK